MVMDRMVVIEEPGGADALKVVPCDPAEPGPGEVRVRHEAIGVNFVDIYFRQGLYALPSYPGALGVEAAGRIDAVGDGVDDLAVGQRVVSAGPPVGRYAATRVLSRSRVVALPDDISSRDAAASMLRGLTAHMLLTRTYPVAAGDTVLVHAAAGGLGTILVRWAKRLGATVIGTAGSVEKADIAKANGADHMIVGRDSDLVSEVTALTGGLGVDFAVDGIGGDMLLKACAAVRPFGVVASIGRAAGPIPPVHIEKLQPISLTRPSVMAYSVEPDTYAPAVRAVFDAMRAGIAASIGAEYPLAEAAAAHIELEAGRTVGSVLLIP